MPFRMPTRVVIEPGCRARVADELLSRGLRSAALVSDPGLRSTPWPHEVSDRLECSGIDVFGFDRVEANPRSGTIEELAAELRDRGTEAVIGLGGGSALDAAKAAAMVATNGGSCADYLGADRYDNRPLPLIAVPTTCGTGSEVTWVSVINVPASATKISVKGESMFPDVALVDADLLASLPGHLVAATGVDALTHAIESTTGQCANPASDALAEKAIALVFRYLRRAATDVAGDAEARRAMAEASTLAGLSFGNSDVGGVHCLSETLGGLYDVPHGLTNALLLAPTLRHYGTAVEKRLGELHSPVFGTPPGDAGAAAAQAVIGAVEDLVADLGLPAFSSLGVRPEDRERIAAGAVNNGSNPSCPKPMTPEDYGSILDAAASVGSAAHSGR